MCHKSCIEFGKRAITSEDVVGRSVIEVGSLNYNGSLRSMVESLGPSKYLGVDIEEGPGVDRVCNAENLVSVLGSESYDLVISTEMLEHVWDWRSVINNIKNITKPGGIMLITTRSKGYGFHGAPFDFWRYEKSDMKDIFADLDIELLESDPHHAGVFIKARRPMLFSQADLTQYSLYSIIKNRRTLDITDFDFRLLKVRLMLQRSLTNILPRPIKRIVRKLMMVRGRRFWLTTHY